MNKKKEVLKQIFLNCKKVNNFTFHNDLVKKVSKKVGFGNPFDATKIDSMKQLPKVILDENYALIHLGKGEHRFVKGLNDVFHRFEKMENTIDWPYKRSLLNLYNSSESNILSVANNQRILHDFLLGSDNEFVSDIISNRPKTYFPHRTKTTLKYKFNDETIIAESIQIEIDLTIEYKGIVGIFEAKNKLSEDFNVYQIFNPYLYYYKAKKDKYIDNRLKDIKCIYLVHTKEKGINCINLWSYLFKEPDISTLKFEKSSKYRLIN